MKAIHPAKDKTSFQLMSDCDDRFEADPGF